MEPAELLLFQIKRSGLPTPVLEFPFCTELGRKWRFDFAWPDAQFAVEYEGGSFVGGAHGRGKHFESDAMKYGIALLLGWRVLRVNSHMVEDGRALLFLTLALGRAEFIQNLQVLAKHRCEKCLTKKEKLKRLAKEMK